MAGKIIADQIQSTTAGTLDTKFVVSGSAKVWCNVDQQSTQNIQDSFNISSITDTAVGFTTHTFTSAMNNTGYANAACCEYNSHQGTNAGVSSTTTVGLAILNNGGSYEDRDDTSIVIMGDLA